MLLSDAAAVGGTLHCTAPHSFFSYRARDGGGGGIASARRQKPLAPADALRHKRRKTALAASSAGGLMRSISAQRVRAARSRH